MIIQILNFDTYENSATMMYVWYTAGL